ncbi:MAG: hypothetical protein Q9182_006550 [Xanthomendoza sp. 2 TL-2023]
MANLRTAKKDLRCLLKQTLSQVSEQSIQRQCSYEALVAQETLYSLPEYHSAKSISVYLSMPKAELTTGPIVLDALQRGKEVYVPYIHRADEPASDTPLSIMDMVQLHSRNDYEKLELDSWGIPTPSEASIAGRKRCPGVQSTEHVGTEKPKERGERLDLVLMPGMAFDRRFGRLGHGRGYYDYFLFRYQRSLGKLPGAETQMPFLVGLALDEQVLPEGEVVPTDPSDWRLDALIAGDKLIRRYSSQIGESKLEDVM